MNKDRIKKLQKQIINPILIKKKENLFYLTGRDFDLRAEEYLLVSKKHVVGFGSGLEQISWIEKSDQLKNLVQYVKKYPKVDIEFGFTFGEAEYLKFLLPKVVFQPTISLVDKAREIKDKEEIRMMAKSMQIVEVVFREVKKQLQKKTWTEVKLARFITSVGFKLGANDISFPPIVACGSNAAVPHHVPSSKKLKAGESIIIDFGFKYKNYCSDFTRTVFLKKVSAKIEAVYHKVEEAYTKSIQVVKPGMKSFQVHQTAVNVLAETELDKYFIHALGHGSGLEIHERPSLSLKSEDTLKPGMVFSVEPGVYIPKLGGVRIEDLVVLRKTGAEKFINISTKLKDNIL